MLGILPDVDLSREDTVQLLPSSWPMYMKRGSAVSASAHLHGKGAEGAQKPCKAIERGSHRQFGDSIGHDKENLAMADAEDRLGLIEIC